MTIFQLDELEVVAVLGDTVSPIELRPLEPVFRRRGLPDRIAWPTRVERHRVLATEVGLDVLDAAVDAGAVVKLPTPIDAKGSDWVLTSSEVGGISYVRRDDLWAKRYARSRERLGAAIRAFHEGEREISTDLFDEAYLTSQRGLVATVLRAGASRLGEDRDWEKMCLADLARAVEYQGASLSSCRASALWLGLPFQPMLDELFDQARKGYDEYCRPDASTPLPVPARVKTLAVAFALYRRLHPEFSARVANKLVIRAVAGEPDAVNDIATRLAADAEWQSCVQRAEAGVTAQILDVSDALARAQLEDLSRFARTLYTLEITSEERDRRAGWTNFCSRTAGVDHVTDAVPWRAGERLADETRQRLGLNGDPIGGLRRFVEEQAGVFVGRMPALQRYDCAGTAPRNTPPCVFVERDEGAPTEDMLRGRFALGHELGHLLMDRHSASGWVCSTKGHDRSDPEKRANAFAVYFIAPRHAVRELVPELPAVDSSEFSSATQRVREKFGLSAVAAGEHLLNCHSDYLRDPLSETVRNRLAQELGSQPVTVDEHADDDDEVEIQGMAPLRGGRYRRLVKRLEGAHVLDSEHAAQLLGQG